MMFCIGDVHSSVLFACYLRFGPYELNYLFCVGVSRKDLQSFEDFCALSIPYNISHTSDVWIQKTFLRIILLF